MGSQHIEGGCGQEDGECNLYSPTSTDSGKSHFVFEDRHGCFYPGSLPEELFYLRILGKLKTSGFKTGQFPVPTQLGLAFCDFDGTIIGVRARTARLDSEARDREFSFFVDAVFQTRLAGWAFQDLFTVFSKCEVNDSKAVRGLSGWRTNHLDSTFLEFLVVVVAVVTIVGQEDVRLKADLFQLLDASDYGLHIGRVGGIDLNLSDDLGVVHVFACGAGFGELDVVADFFPVAVVAGLRIMRVAQRAAFELLVQPDLDKIVLDLDLFLGQPLEQLERLQTCH